MVCQVSSCRVKNPSVCEQERSGRYTYVDLVRLIAKHDWMVFFNESSSLIMGGNKLIVKWDSLKMGARDYLEAAVFNCCII